jgi:hypothetical protein
MKKLLVALIIVGSLGSVEAMAQGRAGDAAIGAVSGAVVLGPVGAVAGAVIGFTAGPSISHAWGVGPSAPPRSRARRETPARLASQTPGARDAAPPDQAAAKPASPPPVKSSEVVPAKKGPPPVQGFD